MRKLKDERMEHLKGMSGGKKAFQLYMKIWGKVGYDEAWIDEDAGTVARYFGEDAGGVAEAFGLLTECGLLRHEPGYGYLIGGDCHAF